MTMSTQGGAASASASASASAPAPAPISSALPAIAAHKLADLRYLSRGASGTVSAARHADWRVRVAVKHLHLHAPLADG